MKRGKLVIISGPSAGVGKDTVIKMFLQKHPDWQMPASTTTRKARSNEVEGKDMNFVDNQTFETWNDRGLFLEAVKVDDGKWYGTLREPVESLLNLGKNVLLRKDVRGALIIKDKLPEATLIFLNADNWQELEKRIRGRGTEDEAAIQRKLALAKTELPYESKYDHTIINPAGHAEEAVKALEAIVLTVR